MKNIIKILAIGFIGGLAGAYTLQFFTKPTAESDALRFNTVALDSASFNPGNISISSHASSSSLAPVDFSEAATKTIPSVVYINSIAKGIAYNSFDWFFGGGGSSTQTQVSSGSGVIFSTDGYIITNNHVVESAERLEVVYNKRKYTAEVIGTDPSTDLAVLKINETNLPAIAIGSSKNLQVGEWVVAVGNPFSLSSTVTVGIVSAKGRRIGILEDKFPIESFIQTDAAINPGNSGGALVNKSGELVGINSAILSRTGSYTGYAFAVPVDIARKVFDDIVKYGIVQKALLGGSVIEYNYENAKKYDLNTNIKTYSGVLIEQLEREGPAMQSGLKLGDIIVKLNGRDINTQSEFEEELSYHYPGDKINIAFLRDGKPQTATLILVNQNGSADLIKREIKDATTLGVQLESTQYGVKVFKINDKSPLKQIGIPENFTIYEINRVRVKKPEEVVEFFEKFKGRGYLLGFNSSKQRVEIPFVIR